MTLTWMVALPFVGSVLLAAGSARARNAAAWTAGVTTLAAGALLGMQAPAIFAGDVIRATWPWLPAIDASVGLRLDGLAFLFALLILGIGALVVLYARYYLAAHDPAVKFYALLLLFMGSMLGVVVAANLIVLVVFWEMTSLSSFLLIAYWHHRSDARQGARMALTLTGGGGLCLLAGVLLLGHAAGSYELDVVLGARAAVQAHPAFVPALVLILLGVFTKSAQWPLHVWLPQAMAAPTPVSAYLHSATMVKAGVFLLARLYPVLGGGDAWFFLVSGAGAATLLVGAWLALFQHDLKGLLAYSTISHLGLITLLFGLSTPLAVVAGVFHILNHAVFKASLFMGAGIIDHECGTRDMRRLAGLWKPMPYTASLAMVAAAAMAGVPLLNGFLSKEMFFAETLALEGRGVLRLAVPVAATLAGVFSVAYSARFIHDVFFNGEPKDLPRAPHEPPRWIKVPVEVLVIACVLVGIFPGQTIGPLLAVAAGAALGGPLPSYSLALWHGVNAPLAMSVVALGGGIALYVGLHRWLNLHTVERGRGGKELFEAALERLVRLAHAVTAGIPRGGLQRFLRLLVLAALAAAAWPFLERGYSTGPASPTAAGPALWTGWLIGVAGALGTVAFVRERFVALVLLGVVGLMVSLTFVYLSAPDLALTQLLVELVTVILMMLTLRFLPLRSPGEPRPRRRIGDAVIALAAGGGVTALVYAVLMRPSEPISAFFLERTLTEGGGANAVNVILVDFRGFDTMGEITVLAVAGLVIHALLQGGHARVAEPGPTPAAVERSSLLPLIARLLLPLTIVVSIFLFLRGHNLPGGGFIGGLVLVVALLIQYIASGVVWVEARVHPQYERWIAIGLLVAGAGGLGSWALGYPFLTSAVLHPVVPVIGDVELASAMVFDLGVFLTVVGASLLALTSIGRLAREGAVEP